MRSVTSTTSSPHTSGTRPAASRATTAAAPSELSPDLLSDHRDHTGPASPPSEPAPVPDQVSILRQQAQEKFGELANTIAEAFPAAVLTAVSGAMFRGAVNAGGFKAHLDNVLAASGKPTDPNEIMLAQQLLWAHHHVGNLISKAAQATTLQEVEVYNQALARIMAEFRRSTLALRDYRSGPSPKQITLVKQQNVATGNQNVAMVDGATSTEAAAEKDRDGKLANKQPRLNHVEFSSGFPALPATDCGALEPVEVQRPDPRRARKAPASGRAQSPLEIFNGAENTNGEGQIRG